jgi:hypothetical protein
MNDAGAKDQGLGAKLLKELENGLLIAYRVKNHALDYSIMNRPEPNLSGVDDHALATAIVYAGNKFRIVHSPTLASRPEKVSRSDGRTITYDELIDIDFDEGVIRTSRRETMTLQMLQGIVGDLMSKATKPSPGVMTEKPRSAN